METKISNSKSFFEMLSSKQAFWLGCVATVLVLGTIGCGLLGYYVVKGGNGVVATTGSDNFADVAGAATGTGAATTGTATDVETLFKKIATDVGLNGGAFDTCRSTDATLTKIQNDQKTASAAGVKGTPSSFIIGSDGKAKQIQGGAVSYASMQALIDQMLGVTTTSTSAAPSLTDVSGTLAPVSNTDRVFGDANSTITIITYSDFQCPYCERFDTSMQQVMKNYSGKVKWIYRNFPLSFHDQAMNAAEAAECAGEQGKFWEYAVKLFENQSSL